MRIGLVLEHFDPHRGGLEHWAWQFGHAMIERGHELHVLAQSYPPADAAPSLRFHRMPGRSSRLKYAAALEQHLATLDLDVVHDTGAGWFCDVYQPHFGSRAALAHRSIDLLSVPFRPLKRLAIRVLPRYRQFAALEARQFVDDGRVFVALSQKVADAFVSYHGVRRSAIRIIPNGVDCDRYSPENRSIHRSTMRQQLGLAPEALLVLMIAHNFRLKGLSSAIQSLAKLHARAPNTHLVVVGGGRPRRYLRLARALGVAPHVTFLGARPDSVPYLAAADVFIHPTYYDACSLVVFEALASGLPVISTRATGVDELMTEGVEGYLVSDPSQTDAMSEHLARLLDPALREEMGLAARRLALQHSFSRNCDAFESLYLEITNRRHRTSEAA